MSSVGTWDGRSLIDLLALQALEPLHLRTLCGDANANGRAYGGQLLGQAVMAAAHTVPPGRPATAMQFMFLQGAIWDEAIDIRVTPLQDGKRFASRHVRGDQSGRMVFDAQLSFAPHVPAPAHGRAPADFAQLPDPESELSIANVPADWSEIVRKAFGYALIAKEVVDLRFIAPPPKLTLSLPDPRVRFWLRLKEHLGDEPNLHAGAFAYLTDWWLNYAALGAHQAEALENGGLYVASLNHAIWFHRPLRADEWLHFDCISPAAANGRGLTVARISNRAGELVASATQECLMAPRLA